MKVIVSSSASLRSNICLFWIISSIRSKNLNRALGIYQSPLMMNFEVIFFVFSHPYRWDLESFKSLFPKSQESFLFKKKFEAERPLPPYIAHQELLMAAEERGEYFWEAQWLLFDDSGAESILNLMVWRFWLFVALF